MCLFCNTNIETLNHLFTCPSLCQQWADISKSSLNFLRSLTTNLGIRAELPIDITLYLPRFTTNPNSSVWTPIQYIVKGILPALVVEDLRNMNIHSNFNTICTSLLKHAIEAFRKNIWKPRCILNTDKEKHLDIIKAKKDFAL